MKLLLILLFLSCSARSQTMESSLYKYLTEKVDTIKVSFIVSFNKGNLHQRDGYVVVFPNETLYLNEKKKPFDKKFTIWGSDLPGTKFNFNPYRIRHEKKRTPGHK